MESPTFTDYVTLMHTLFDRFTKAQTTPPKPGRPYDFQTKSFLIFFVRMHMRRTFAFQAQYRWLKAHPKKRNALGFQRVVHRCMISRRYKALYRVVQAFIAFVGTFAQDLDPKFRSKELFWVTGRDATAYQHFLQQTENQELMRLRRTTIEPSFDLIAKLIGATDNHKQIAQQGLPNVRTLLALGVFILQLVMIINSVWGLDLHAISYCQAAWP